MSQVIVRLREGDTPQKGWLKLEWKAMISLGSFGVPNFYTPTNTLFHNLYIYIRADIYIFNKFNGWLVHVQPKTWDLHLYFIFISDQTYPNIKYFPNSEAQMVTWLILTQRNMGPRD